MRRYQVAAARIWGTFKNGKRGGSSFRSGRGRVECELYPYDSGYPSLDTHIYGTMHPDGSGEVKIVRQGITLYHATVGPEIPGIGDDSGVQVKTVVLNPCQCDQCKGKR